MKTLHRSILGFLMAFSLLGLVACDDAGMDDGVGGGGEGTLEEPLAPAEPVD